MWKLLQQSCFYTEKSKIKNFVYAIKKSNVYSEMAKNMQHPSWIWQNEKRLDDDRFYQSVQQNRAHDQRETS